MLAPGEVGTVIVISPSQKQSRVIKRYVAGLMHASPLLSALIASETETELALTNGHVIEIVTASKAAPRGRTLIAVVIDEGSFISADDGAAEPLSEILNACRPGLATTNGLLMVIGSPHAKLGPVFDTFTRYFGKNTDVFVVKGATQRFNPTIPDSVIAAATEADPSVAASEWGAEFRSDLEQFVTREAVARCVVPGRLELPRVAGVTTYHGFLDFAGGSVGGDSATLAIAHNEKRGDGHRVVVLDLVVEVKPPFSPAAVCTEFAATIRAFGLASAVSDRWAGQFPVELMGRLGIHVTASAKAKSTLYLETLPLINSQSCELLDHPRLLAQLVSLERRVARSGQTSVDHPAGAHDDLVNAAAGAMVAAAMPRPTVELFDPLTGERHLPWPDDDPYSLSGWWV